MGDDVGHVIGGPGQRTSDRAGGYDAEVRQPRVLTWDRMKRRAAEALFLLLVVPLLIGPWALVVYVPLLMERGILALASWLEIDVETDRVSMLCLALFTFAVVALAPDALLSWWPFPGQVSRASWRGLLWPSRWPGTIPLVILLRVVPVVAALRAWREVWYLDQRQRQETITPTISSVAYEQADPGAVEIPGVYNPHRTTQRPAEQVEIVRTFRVEDVPAEAEPVQALATDQLTGTASVTTGGNDNGHHRRIIEIPVGLLGDTEAAALRRIRAVAYGTLEDKRPWSRPEWAGDKGLFGPTEWRTLNAWLVEHGLVYKIGSKRNDPHEWTRGGRYWLAAFRDGV